MRKNSIKMTRINQEIVKELSNILRNEVKDPRIDPLISVTGADTGTDLKTCKVYVSVYGDEGKMAETLAGLKKAEGYIRHLLAVNLNLRNTPQLTFLPDRSIVYGMHISEILDTLEEQGAIAKEEPGETEA